MYMNMKVWETWHLTSAPQALFEDYSGIIGPKCHLILWTLFQFFSHSQRLQLSNKYQGIWMKIGKLTLDICLHSKNGCHICLICLSRSTIFGGKMGSKDTSWKKNIALLYFPKDMLSIAGCQTDLFRWFMDMMLYSNGWGT